MEAPVERAFERVGEVREGAERTVADALDVPVGALLRGRHYIEAEGERDGVLVAPRLRSEYEGRAPVERELSHPAVVTIAQSDLLAFERGVAFDRTSNRIFLPTGQELEREPDRLGFAWPNNPEVERLVGERADAVTVLGRVQADGKVRGASLRVTRAGQSRLQNVRAEELERLANADALAFDEECVYRDGRLVRRVEAVALESVVSAGVGLVGDALLPGTGTAHRAFELATRAIDGAEYAKALCGERHDQRTQPDDEHDRDFVDECF